jgi:hypothetical protein
MRLRCASTLDLASGSRVGQMRADGRFDQPPPEFPVAAGLGQCQSGWGREKRGVEHLQLGAGPAAPGCVTGVLLKAHDQTGAAEQIQVMRQRGGVAGVVQLAQHLRVRQHLAGVAARELEQPSK